MMSENEQSQQSEKNMDSVNETENNPVDFSLSEEETLLQPDSQNEEIARLSEEVASLRDQVLRERAENENLRKRQEREISNIHKFSNERIIKELLPVLDSLVLGLQAAKDNADKPDAMQQFVEGTEMILNILSKNLKKHGVEDIDPIGEKFNPDLHEAVTMMPSPEHENGTIIHVAQKGYTLNGRVLRAAQVVVAKND